MSDSGNKLIRWLILLTEYVKKINRKYVFNYKINCPMCSGNGMVVYVKETTHYLKNCKTNAPPSFWVRKFCDLPKFKDKLKNPPFREIENEFLRKFDLTRIYTRGNCPYCGGDGVALAKFYEKNFQCDICNSVGNVSQVEKKTNSIGSEKIVYKCEKCSGNGLYFKKYVLFKTKVDSNLALPDNFWQKKVGKKIFMSEINQSNFEFYEKREKITHLDSEL
ncbi:hypothetical protein SAMN05660860_01853 [Geoalkalibacter ferrihydriticus]|uniref:Uncharacterized protein n=1 Tax=Geoalkalibacter ferrihydriticus TaxID=392333 RepID=A0A1G9QNN4_9BACT|nr:hypothetical protein [Geoalkalibacter ferrihydriticus]SDM12624.1 hypothetical protein SAMN05660860_01853 [Geoalkalibacter ferrihydriticus]